MFAARRNRFRIRVSLLAILFAALIGGMTAHRYWQQQATAFTPTSLTPTIDWVDLISVLGEEIVHAFVGAN